MRTVEDLGIQWLPTQTSWVPRNASLLAVDEWTARLATDDPRDPPVAAFAIGEASSGRVALDLAQLHRPELLLVHLPFLWRGGASARTDAVAAAVLNELRWCPDHLLRRDHDARVATAAASCWGRGVAVDGGGGG